MAEPTIQLGGGNWAGKSGNLLGYYEQNKKFYAEDFTFSRSTTGTYTDKEGYIQEMPYNLLTYSEDFSQWSLTRAISTANAATSPDGTNNAYKLQSNTTGSNGSWYRQVISAFNGGHNLSVYAKKNSSDFLQLRIDGLGGVVFNLDTGVVKSQSSAVGSIEDVGNGWYRCSAQMTSSSSTIILLIVGNENMTPQNWSSTSGDSVYLWGAQLNSGTSAKTYFPTTTRLNMPRVDYKDNPNGSLKLEPQRTNLIPYSEDFSQWQRVNISTGLSNTLSPDGLSFMTKATFSSSGLNSYIRQNISMNSGSITFSCFVKKGLTDSFVKLRIINLDNPVVVWFNLDDGTISSETGSPTNKSIVDYGNGIYRVSATTTSTSDLSLTAIIQSASSDGGDPTENATQFYWGGQAEQGSYPTSIINTSGSSVTRNADACSITNVADRIGQTEGSVFLDITRDSLESYTQRVLTLSNGTTNNVIGLQLTAENQITFYVENGGSNQVVITKSNATTENVNVKIGASYKANDFVMYIDGVQVGVDTSGSVPTTSVIKYASPSGSLQYVGSVNNFKLYNTRLSNSELAELTTL